MDIQIQIPVEDAQIVFDFLGKNVGSTFGHQLMPVVNTMDALARAIREAENA